MEKINVKICVGTMCYVMGGAELRDTIESLPQNILEHLNVSYSPCLGCGKGEQAPPFIEVKGKQLLSRRTQHHVCTRPKDGEGCLLPQYKPAQP